MTKNECNEALSGNLLDSIRHVLDLRALLDEERQALEHKDTVSLSDTAVRKQSCINRLEELDRSRMGISAACGFGDTPGDIARLVAHCDRDDRLSQSWNRFIAIARECSEMNSGNGAIIRVRQEQIRGAINLLRDGSNDTGTYGPDGRDGENFRMQSLAEA